MIQSGCFVARCSFMDAERCKDQSMAVSLFPDQEKPKLIHFHSKIRVIFLLSLGLFVMGMAIARCILSIGTSVQVALSSVWAQREAVSLPFTYKP
jgi:hypothetical protein